MPDPIKDLAFFSPKILRRPYLCNKSTTGQRHSRTHITQDLHNQLLQPFDSEAAAKKFWNESSSTLILLSPTDNITALKDVDEWSQIYFALTYPEYTVPLAMNHQLLVAIINDSGSGIYLVVPPELSHIIPENS